MATAATAPTVGFATPYGSRSGARCLVIACHADWFPFGTPKYTTSKNGEENGASALGGRRLLAAHNNQLGVGGRDRRNVGEEARGGWNMWEGGIQLLEATNSTRKKYRIKIHCDLRQPPVNEFTHNNQPNPGANIGAEEG